jgi:tetratricopeptide (TPR) repeat protein
MSAAETRQLLDAATAHHRAGRLREAQAAYQQVLSREPDNPDALGRLGALALQVGRADVAVGLLGRAVTLQPDFAPLRRELAGAYRALGRWPEALQQYRRAVAIDPASADSHCDLATALGAAGREGEAQAEFQRALEIDPGHAVANYNLGVSLQQQGHFAEAAESLRRAIARAPAFAIAHNNLGSVLRELGEPEEAIASYRRAIELAPADPRYRSNIALALQDLCRLDEAIESFDTALRLRPDYAKGRAFRALALLLKGDYERGWADYEWRRAIGITFADRSAGRPLWDGSDPAGRTILLHSEQGIGDTIQFVRYAPLLAARGARVIVQCQPTLKALLEPSLTARGVWRVLAEGEPAPEFDSYCPLPGLPHRFGTRPATIPAEVPYLDARPERVEDWRRWFSDPARVGSDQFKVGIVWAGAVGNRNDRRRSVRATDFMPLAQVPGVCLYSLQKGPPVAQLGESAPGLPAHDLDARLNDFADTAAALMNLDLVVTVDTSVAHLAGALGRPVWTLIPFSPDFRWMLGRSDSPWYPTMRLFRQGKPEDWDGVFREVAVALRDAASGGRTHSQSQSDST